jgi:hypothetical protein
MYSLKVPLIFFMIALVGWWWNKWTPSSQVAVDASSGQVLDCPLPRTLDGESASSVPLQTDVGSRFKAFKLGDATVTPLAGFSVKAAVLSKTTYRHDAGAKYAPVDLALGWGPMADSSVYKKLSITQDGRWYNYRWGGEGPPIAQSDIAKHSANMHLVAASKDVAKALGRVEADQTVQLDGWLVRIEEPSGWNWQSSLTRDDTGGGACELVYVCRVQ